MAENETGSIQATQELPPIKIAFIIDSEVVDVLHTDERLAAIFLSSPLILDITQKYNENPGYVRPGMIYDPKTDSYITPETKENKNV